MQQTCPVTKSYPVLGLLFVLSRWVHCVDQIFHPKICDSEGCCQTNKGGYNFRQEFLSGNTSASFVQWPRHCLAWLLFHDLIKRQTWCVLVYYSWEITFKFFHPGSVHAGFYNSMNATGRRNMTKVIIMLWSLQYENVISNLYLYIIHLICEMPFWK